MISLLPRQKLKPEIIPKIRRSSVVDVINRGEVATRTSTICRAVRRKQSRLKKLQCLLEKAKITGSHQEVDQLTAQCEEAKKRLAYQEARLGQCTVRS